MFRNLIFDGISLKTYGLYISGDAVYDSPERDVEMISIPGRNGTFALDKGRFNNIEVTYPAGVFSDSQTNFADKVSALRNQLASRTGYRRIEDEYHPDEYRMGVYKRGLEFDPVHYNEASEFEITFDCKPQRFLKSGDEPITLSEWGEVETYSGSIVSFDGTEATGIRSLKVNIAPKQSGSGDPSPSNVRPISGWDSVETNVTGKNLIPKVQDSAVLNGITPTLNADGSITLNGTATANANFYGERITLKAGTYIVSGGDSVVSGTCVVYLDGVSGSTDGGGGKAFTLTQDTRTRAVVRVYSGKTVSNVTIYPMVRFATESAEYEPYQGSTITTNLPQTVYGGVLDVVSGVLTAFPYYSSYNGQTLNGEWICDRAVYSQGTTPPTGSQVVDMSGTGTELTSTPTEVNTLPGQNNIWADAGIVDVEIGENPNILVNPTLFESKPLLMVNGYGDINIDDEAISIDNVVIGDVLLSNGARLEDTTTGTLADMVTVGVVEFDQAKVNTGDTITLKPTTYTINIGYNNLLSSEHVEAEVTNQSGVGASSGGALSRTTASYTVNMPAVLFTVGTAGSVQHSASWIFRSVSIYGDYSEVTFPMVFNIAYDGANTITITAKHWYEAGATVQTTGTTGDLTGYSTVLVDGTIYIDLDIGEAYWIKDGTVISANYTVHLGADLPTLKPGINNITYTTRITSLEIIPRWWKI